MDITKAKQIALDDALVAPANRLKIGKCNLRLSSYLTSKEATLQVVYDLLKLTPFYKAFQASIDVPEIYMQEEMLQICPKIRNQKFDEPPFEQEILTFLVSLGHSGEIRKITDVNVNKLHQPWRSFAAVINKCLSGKSSYDSLRLSQAQIIWGMYHKKNVDYAFLLWEDFTYQVENKNTKKVNVMYYPRFTKLIVNFFMSKDPSIPRRNKINWHYARDDPMFTTINVISRHEDTQLYGAILPKELTNEDIRNSESYKEYYAIASGEVPPKTKASVHKKKADSDTTPKEKPPTDPKDKRVKQTGKMTGSGKQKQPTTGLETLSETALTETEQLKIAIKRSRIQTHSSQASGSGDGVDILSKVPNEQVHEKKGKDEGAGDKPKTFSDDDDDDEDEDANKDSDAHDDDDDATKSDADGGNITHPKQSSLVSDLVSNFISPTTDEGIDSTLTPHTESTTLVNVHISVAIETPATTTTIPPPLFPVIQSSQQTPVTTTTTTNPSTTPLPIPNFASVFGFNQRVTTIKATNEQLDWNNFEGTPYPHNLSKLLPLIPNARGRLVIPFDHFINNNLEYLKGGSSSRKYTTSITKTKAAGYGQVKWIEDRIPRTTWSVVPIDNGKHAYWGTYHWGPKRQRFYGYATNMETSKDVYSRHKIIAIISLKIMKFFGYSHLEEITVRRQDDVLYKFREGDFKRLRRQDIEDMLLLLVQGKLTNLSMNDRYALNVALRMHTRRIVIQERVEDLQLAVERYQKKINLTRPDTTRPDLRKMNPYTGYPDVQGIIYQDELSINWLMRTDELHKFSDGTPYYHHKSTNRVQNFQEFLRIVMEYVQKTDHVLNLWRFKWLRHRYDKTEKSEKGKKPTEMELTLEQTQQGVSYEVSVDPHGFEGYLKMDVRNFRYSDTERLSRSDEVLKLKNFKKDATLKLSKSTNQECILHISLEVDTQLNQEIFQRDNSVSNQSSLSFDQLFELNELKAQSQEKDTVIKKLKERIKSLSEKLNEDKIKKDLEEIETINIELDHRVSKLIAKNKHLKQTYKQLYDSIKLARIQSKEQCDDLINQVNLHILDNHDLCVLDFINNVNARTKSKSVKKNSKRKVWKPTGKVFTNIGYIWRPTSRTFTIVGNACPLTRITTNTEVPLRKPTARDNETTKPIVTLVYSRKSRKYKTNVPVNKSKVVQIVLWYLDSGCSKHMTGDRSQLTNFVKKNLGTFKFGNDHVEKILGYGDYQIGNVMISRVYYVEGLGHNLFSVGSKDEAPDFIIKFLKMIQVRLKVPVRRIRTDNGTEFVNQTLREYYEKVGISHETSVARSPQQNGVVERRNRTLIEAARTMLIYAKAPLFLWAEAVATACYTQNRSIVRLRHGKTPYELLHDKLPDLSFFHVFGALCYPTKSLSGSTSGPALHEITHATISSGLAPNPHPSTPFVPPSRTSEVIAPIDEVVAPVLVVSTGSPSSTTVDQDAPSPSNSQTTPETQSPILPNDVEEDNHDLDVAHMNNDPFFGITIPENDSEASSLDVIPIVVQTASPNSEHITKSIQEELHEFERIEVWELVPRPDKVMVITLKWIYKVKLDELGGILKNKARLVARGYRQEEGINFEESFCSSG
ncbi:retrovirus-related pol polyprotein from transposon TNT 1-94 [Tanacetum coccineum]